LGRAKAAKGAKVGIPFATFAFFARHSGGFSLKPAVLAGNWPWAGEMSGVLIIHGCGRVIRGVVLAGQRRGRAERALIGTRNVVAA
jgi:hypothetical protein